VDWIVAIIAAAVLVLVVLTAGILQRRARRALASERADLVEARKSMEHLETRVTTLRHELSDEHRANAELNAQLHTAGDVRAAGLWALERLRQSRLLGTPALPTSGPGVDIATDLRSAIGLELELLREEVGTYAEVTSFELGSSVSPREALAVLRIIQELTATFAKRADELRLDIDRDGDSTRVTVIAVGWSEAIPNPMILERGVAALEGTLELSAEASELTAAVRIPDRGA
jgi:hypothetical protein